MIAVLLMLVINLGLYSDGEELFEFLLEPISEYFYVDGEVLNGYLIAYLSLNTLWVHIPVLIIIVTTYIFSGEFELGTIRLLLTQQVTRNNLLLAKIITMFIYNFCFMAVIAIFALYPSILLFGKGDVVVFIDGIQFIQEASFMSRFINSVLFASLAMIAFSSMTMYFALVFKNTLTSILLSLGILILLTLFQTFVFGIFSSWQPFLFTYHIAKWQLFFVNEIPVKSILSSVYFLTGMTLVFVVISLHKFNKMNISE